MVMSLSLFNPLNNPPDAFIVSKCREASSVRDKFEVQPLDLALEIAVVNVMLCPYGSTVENEPITSHN